MHLKTAILASILLATLASPVAAGSRVEGYVVFAGRVGKTGIQRVCATTSTVLHARCLKVQTYLTEYARHDSVSMKFDADGNLTGIAH